MRKLTKELVRTDRPWMIITSGLLLYTLFDIYDHITRPNSSFAEHPVRWGLFSVCSFLTIIGVMFMTTQLLSRLHHRLAVFYETVGLLTAIGCHIYLSGPFYNRIFWSEEILNFRFKLVPVLILCGIYLFLRLIVFNGFRYLFKSRNRTDE